MSSTTVDWCHNSTLRVDDFTALRRRWRRCSMIYHRQPMSPWGCTVAFNTVHHNLLLFRVRLERRRFELRAVVLDWFWTYIWRTFFRPCRAKRQFVVRLLPVARMMIVIWASDLRTLFKHDDVCFKDNVLCLHVLTGLECFWETDMVREEDRSGWVI